MSRRKAFPEVQGVTQRLINAMKQARGAPLPLDKATLCVTLDVIGRVGFAKDFGATSSFQTAIENPQPLPAGASCHPESSPPSSRDNLFPNSDDFPCTRGHDLLM